jgi:hypothetical protein
MAQLGPDQLQNQYLVPPPHLYFPRGLSSLFLRPVVRIAGLLRKEQPFPPYSLRQSAGGENVSGGGVREEDKTRQDTTRQDKGGGGEGGMHKNRQSRAEKDKTTQD